MIRLPNVKTIPLSKLTADMELSFYRGKNSLNLVAFIVVLFSFIINICNINVFPCVDSDMSERITPYSTVHKGRINLYFYCRCQC